MLEVINAGFTGSTAPISNAVKVGGIVYTVQLPRNPVSGEIEVDGDIKDQTRRSLLNLKHVLETAGGSLANVAQVLVYLIDAADAPGMNKVYAEFFAPPYPNRATVVVQALLVPGMRIEMVVHAHLEA
ncbi:MAG: RidA family protein [Burkholderiaceae bacterium]